MGWVARLNLTNTVYFFAPGLSLGNLRITLRCKVKRIDASGENPMKSLRFLSRNDRVAIETEANRFFPKLTDFMGSVQ